MLKLKRVAKNRVFPRCYGVIGFTMSYLLYLLYYDTKERTEIL
jgi:hypothetical protein